MCAALLAHAAGLAACAEERDARSAPAAEDATTEEETPAGTTGGSAECCPRDIERSGSMRLGGPRSRGCYVTHDFWCTTDWEVLEDENGCEVWRYGLVPSCDPRNPDGGGAGPIDAGTDADAS